MNHLDEIRAKLNIEELVSGYVQLKKAGRNLKGLCPFHNDSRPSFMVSPEKGIAYCFSCNQGGDIFKFIQLIEKVEFPEAVRILAERVGVKLPEYKPELQDEKQRLLKANEAAARFYEKQLQTSEFAKQYFQKRGLESEIITTFKLGFSPDSYKLLKEALLSEGFTEKELLTAGLLNQRSIADQNTYDRFRGRLMFPIADHQNNIVGFGGRIFEEGEPKYLNSPDTPIYNKSFVLYGLNLAKEAIKQNDLAIFVEGYMDVITCHQAGTKNVIATSGTALTPGQLKLIKRYTNNIALAFDQDTAGMEATNRAIELAKEADLNIKIILIPNGKDPDECIRESKEKWLEAIQNAVPAIDFYFNHALKRYDKNTLDGRKAISDFLLPIIKLYPTSMEQDEYLKRLAFELKTETKWLWEDMKRLKFQVPGSKFQARNPESQNGVINRPHKGFQSPEEHLLSFILSYPEQYSLIKDQLIDFKNFDLQTEKIYRSLKKVYDSKGKLELALLKEEISEEDQEKLNILSLLVDEHYPDISPETVEKEMSSLISTINKKNIKLIQKEYVFKISSAQNLEERNLLLNEYNELLKHNYKL